MMLVVFLSTGAIPVENTLLVRYAPNLRHGLLFRSKFMLGLVLAHQEFIYMVGFMNSPEVSSGFTDSCFCSLSQLL
jgi:ABC-type polysaccharide transport system permease subunit